MPEADLSTRSQREMQQYYKNGDAETAYSYELFRRALGERNERAWAEITRIYHGMVKTWVLKHGRFEDSGEEADYFVNRAFERLWRYVACKPGKFAQFSELPAILQYLKLCAHASVTDDAPSLSVPTSSIDGDGQQGRPDVDSHIAAPNPLRSDQTNAVETQELWQIVESYLVDQVEQIVFVGFFREGLKNRELLHLYPQHFKDAKEISNKRTSILRRLSRNEEFKEILQEFFYADRGRSGLLMS